MHDAKRRPRWGLRWKLDVAHVFATDVRLELTEKALYGQSLFGGAMMGNARSVSLPHVHVPRDAIVNQDKRREQGVYLGEVVFTLIFALLNKVAYLYPARVVSNGTLAAVLGLKNKAKGAGTRAGAASSGACRRSSSAAESPPSVIAVTLAPRLTSSSSTSKRLRMEAT